MYIFCEFPRFSQTKTQANLQVFISSVSIFDPRKLQSTNQSTMKFFAVLLAAFLLLEVSSAASLAEDNSEVNLTRAKRSCSKLIVIE
jgi:hypothetical protein